MTIYQATEFEGLVVATDSETGESWNVAPATYEWEKYQVWLADGGVLAPAASRGVEDARQSARERINRAADERLRQLSQAYPDGEIASWPQQTTEAESLVKNLDAAAPLLRAIAAARNVPLQDLATRVRAKVAAYAEASGQIIGQRQALEDAIYKVKINAPDAIEAMDGINWPDS